MANTKKPSSKTSSEKARQQQENVKQQGHQSGLEQPQQKYPHVSGTRSRRDVDEIEKADKKYRGEDEETANENRQSTGSSSRQGV